MVVVISTHPYTGKTNINSYNTTTEEARKWFFCNFSPLTAKNEKLKRNNLQPADAYNLELFFELSPDLLCIAGYDGYFKRINPSVSKLLGYTEAELFARPINEFVYPDDKGITAKNRENLTKDIPLLNFENRYVTKTGEIVWLSWTSMPVDAEKLVYAIAKNITHKKKLEEDRNTLLANFAKINQDLKQLTYTTSHDLRAPVTNLLAAFSLLDVSKIQDEETLKFIELLRLSTEGLKNTLNNYVDVLSQKDSLHVQLEELDLSEGLNAALQSLNSLIKNSKATITVDFSAVQKIRFNKTYLQSIFLNLLTNAIKYTRQGEITVGLSDGNGKVNFYVKDTGVGISDEDKKNLFTEGGRGKDSVRVNVDSTGYGLYTVKLVIEAHKGKVWAESEGEGKGSTFFVEMDAVGENTPAQ